MLNVDCLQDIPLLLEVNFLNLNQNKTKKDFLWVNKTFWMAETALLAPLTLTVTPLQVTMV